MSHWEESTQSDEWYTPKYVFDALGCSFDLDVASPIDRRYCCVPAQNFITKNSLLQNWSGYCWMNPPFGGRNGLQPWLDKMALHGNGIALTPDRTSAPWWQSAALQCDALLFVRKKIKFIKPDGSTGDSPSHGITLFAYGELALTSIMRAQENKLGLVFMATIKTRDREPCS